MKILFIGDIVGRPGRKVVQKHLPGMLKQEPVDIVIANAENAAGGHGATPEIIQELKACGVDAFTMGNHTWRKKVLFPILESSHEIVRPANYPAGAPGRGSTIIELNDGRKIGLLNLQGRVYMEPLDCPFALADTLLDELRKETNCILLDMHAEATSEKVAMGWHVAGRCSALVGTHTHIQTADEWILPGGTAYITDVGMCGPYHSVIGTDREPVLKRFKTGLPQSFNVAQGPAQFCAVHIETNDQTGTAREIRRIYLRDE